MPASMPITQSIARLAASVIAILHNRLELATVEIEEESLRIYSSLMLTLLALFCGTFAVVLLVFLCISLFWDSHRIAVMLVFIALFAFLCWRLVAQVRHQYHTKPAFLSFTLAEIAKDVEALKPPPEGPV